MKQIFFLAAAGNGAGLTSVCLGVLRAMERRGIRAAFCKPIGQNTHATPSSDISTIFLEATSGKTPPAPIPIHEAERYIREERVDDLMELVVGRVKEAAQDCDVVLVESLLPAENQTYNNRLNRMMVTSLNAEVILVAAYREEKPAKFEKRIETLAALYGGIESGHLIGCIINRIGRADATTTSGVVPVVDAEPTDATAADGGLDEKNSVLEELRRSCKIFKSGKFELLGGIPLNREFLSCRTSDVARHLGARVLVEGDMMRRRVRSIALCARQASRIFHVYAPGALLIMPSDREDVIMGAALAALNNIPLAGILLTGESALDARLENLMGKALETGLPVLHVPTGSYETALNLSKMSPEVPGDDIERINLVMDSIARNIGTDWIEHRRRSDFEFRLSPAAFRHSLAESARKANKRIILPEGDEPRTIQAAIACHERKIARCVLLGQPDEIRRVAEKNGLSLPAGIEILDASAIRPNYVAPLVEMRKHKNLTEKDAWEALEDNVMLGTVLLALGEVDGLVSGAVHSSANTIRPALQIIKTKPGARVVSSVFFMCLPEQVLVYGDCAVMTNPTAEELADIAVQSADSASRFGIPPCVALISYSTGESGHGADVDKVRKATELARAMRPDLLLDGPLQYDAAANQSVAEKKAPNSPVAGKATVFVFPDLNTGNTTYKAVQRSANLISIGPMLQGLRKPVNDLSRGALVDDIIYTIAVTAIQAAQ